MGGGRLDRGGRSAVATPGRREVGVRVHVRELPLVELDDPRLQLRQRLPQREPALGQPPLEDGEGGLGSVGPGERPRLRHGRLGARGSESGQRPRRQEGSVDGDDDRDRVARGAEAGDEAGDRGADG